LFRRAGKGQQRERFAPSDNAIAAGRTEHRATKLRPVLRQDRLVLRGIPPCTAATPALHPTTASRASPEDRPVPGDRYRQ